MPDADPSLLQQIVNTLGTPPSYAERGVSGSIMAIAAQSYGSNSVIEDVTQPTGFDPEVAALFESLVESAFLVANADGDFDDAEREAFEHVVLAVCNGKVAVRQVHALLLDLETQLEEDGLERRVEMIGRTVKRPEHALEVLRVAALLAEVSGGVSDIERDVLGALAKACNVDESNLSRALSEATLAFRS
ncbi:MAG: tellurite resistance TerB family protein [Polyangiaceae bacterium]|nr:tellurite resistance TerB family protein [Polyangiaceae bacterium]